MAGFPPIKRGRQTGVFGVGLKMSWSLLVSFESIWLMSSSSGTFIMSIQVHQLKSTKPLKLKISRCP